MEYLSENVITKDYVASNRQIIEKFYSVQFAIDGRAPLYQFRIKNIPPDGPGILVGEKSAVLSRLNVGDELDMTYCPCGAAAVSKELRTKVMRVDHHTEGRFEGHVAIGLSVVEQS
jgi:hypothetical protein